MFLCCYHASSLALTSMPSKGQRSEQTMKLFPFFCPVRAESGILQIKYIFLNNNSLKQGFLLLLEISFCSVWKANIKLRRMTQISPIKHLQCSLESSTQMVSQPFRPWFMRPKPGTWFTVDKKKPSEQTRNFTEYKIKTPRQSVWIAFWVEAEMSSQTKKTQLPWF